MSNRVTLAQLEKMSVKDGAAIPTDQLALLLEDFAQEKSRVASVDKKLSAILDEKFSQTAATMRQDSGKDTGTVRFEDGKHTVIADLPKKVDWDQKKLHVIGDQLADEGENPSEYIQQKFTVSETAYKAWPSSIQSRFTSARTVSTGKPTYKIERAA